MGSSQPGAQGRCPRQTRARGSWHGVFPIVFQEGCGVLNKRIAGFLRGDGSHVKAPARNGSSSSRDMCPGVQVVVWLPPRLRAPVPPLPSRRRRRRARIPAVMFIGSHVCEVRLAYVRPWIFLFPPQQPGSTSPFAFMQGTHASWASLALGRVRSSLVLRSGLIYLLMEWLMASMVFACWSTRSTSNFIKFLKFVELTADNMVVITNLAICANLAVIVAVSPALGGTSVPGPRANPRADSIF